MERSTDADDRLAALRALLHNLNVQLDWRIEALQALLKRQGEITQQNFRELVRDTFTPPRE